MRASTDYRHGWDAIATRTRYRRAREIDAHAKSRSAPGSPGRDERRGAWGARREAPHPVNQTSARILAWRVARASIIAATERAPDWKMAVAFKVAH